MKSNLFKMLAGAVAFVGVVGAAQAGAVLDTSGVIAGSGTDSNTFAIASAGVYTATLTDHKFPEPLSFLGMAVFQGASFLNGITSAGSFTFNAPTAGSYKATVFGTASAPFYFGSYGLTIAAVTGGLSVAEAPGGLTVATVPEADTWAMMLVGVGLVGFQLLGRRSSRRLS